MDTKRSWEQVWEPPLQGFVAREANYVCHTDGGSRANSCAAAGWYLEAIVTRGQHRHTFPLDMSGVFRRASFVVLAETIAVDSAIAFLSCFPMKSRAVAV